MNILNNYINKYVRRISIVNLIIPSILSILLLGVSHIISFSDLTSPVYITSASSAEKYYNKDKKTDTVQKRNDHKKESFVIDVKENRKKENEKKILAYLTVIICNISVAPIPIALEPVTMIVSPGLTNPVFLAISIPLDKISSVVYFISLLTGSTPQESDN